MSSETISTVIDRALDAYSALGERIDQVAMSRGGETAPDEISTAIDRAIEEIGRIEDEHRAIDWLSTFPQIVLLALGEAP